MKKIYIIFILLSVCAFAFDENISNALKLSDKKKQKIEAIELKYSKRKVEFNSEILLKKMQLAQYKGTKNNIQYINAINYEIKELNEKLSQDIKDKEKEIVSCLNLFQKIKYRKLKNSN